MKSCRINGWACATAILLGLTFCEVAAADEVIVVRPGAAPALPDTTPNDTVVLRGARPANPAPNPDQEASRPRVAPATMPFCPPGFDCGGKDLDYDRTGLTPIR